MYDIAYDYMILCYEVYDIVCNNMILFNDSVCCDADLYLPHCVIRCDRSEATVELFKLPMSAITRCLWLYFAG